MLKRLLWKLFGRHYSFQTYGHHPGSEDCWTHHRTWWLFYKRATKYKVER